MSSRVSSHNASNAIQTINNIDLPDDKPNLQAILLLTSELATYSISLQVNNRVVCSIKNSIPLLLHCTSSSEDKGSTILTKISLKDYTYTRRNQS